MKKLYYIYGLVDPNDKIIRYIGLTTNPQNRYNQHYYNHQIQSKEKYEWINGLKLQNLRPEMTILETIETDDRNAALNLEQNLMDSHRETLIYYRHPQVLKNSNKGKYVSILIKSELKQIMDQTIIKIGKKMSYSQLIKYLIENGNLDDNKKL